MLAYKKKPSSNCFAGNPVVFILSSDKEDRIGFSVSCENIPVYEGIIIPRGNGGLYSASIDISDIVRSCFKDYRVVDPSAIISGVDHFSLPIGLL